jgi:hypothetical protein
MYTIEFETAKKLEQNYIVCGKINGTGYLLLNQIGQVHRHTYTICSILLGIREKYRMMRKGIIFMMWL